MLRIHWDGNSCLYSHSYQDCCYYAFSFQNHCWKTLPTGQRSQSPSGLAVYLKNLNNLEFSSPGEFPASTSPYLDNVTRPRRLTLSESWLFPDTWFIFSMNLGTDHRWKDCVSSSTIEPYCHMLNCKHAKQIRVCPQALQSYIFIIVLNKIGLIHWFFSPGELSPSLLMDCIQSFFLPLVSLSLLTWCPTGLEGKKTPTNHVCYYQVKVAGV